MLANVAPTIIRIHSATGILTPFQGANAAEEFSAQHQRYSAGQVAHVSVLPAHGRKYRVGVAALVPALVSVVLMVNTSASSPALVNPIADIAGVLFNLNKN